MPPSYQPAVVEISTLSHAAYPAPHNHNISFCWVFIQVSLKLVILRKLQFFSLISDGLGGVLEVVCRQAAAKNEILMIYSRIGMKIQNQDG